MNRTHANEMRTLAVAPSTRGCGFAVLEGSGMLVHWGVKSVKGNKNVQSVSKVKDLISQFHPEGIVLEDPTRYPVRSERIQALIAQIVVLARQIGIKVTLLPRKEIRQIFFGDGKGTKHALALMLAERFPEELASRLPPKRRPWMSEDHRMDIFDAVALCLAFCYCNRR